jgi:hypothetical protein
MKILLLGVLFAIIQASSPVPRKATNHPTDRSHTVNQQGTGNQKPAATMPVQGQPSAPSGENKSAVKQAENENYQVSVRELPTVSVERDWLYLGLTAALVIIGGITFVAIWHQAVQTRKSAEYMEKSVRLQEVGMRQWLQFSDWETDTPFPNKNFIRLSCRIINPTDRRLTVRNVDFWSTYWTLPRYDAQWTVAPRDFCPFQVPGIQLAGKLLEDFEKGRLELVIRLTVDFDDAFRKREEPQIFSRECICGRYQPCKTRPVWPGPTRQGENAEQNPN